MKISYYTVLYLCNGLLLLTTPVPPVMRHKVFHLRGLFSYLPIPLTGWGSISSCFPWVLVTIFLATCWSNWADSWPTHLNPEDGTCFKTLVSAYRAKQCYSPEHHSLKGHHHGNLKTYIIHVCVLCSSWGECLAGLTGVGSGHFTGRHWSLLPWFPQQMSYDKSRMINWEDRLYLLEFQCSWGQSVTPLKQIILAWVSYFIHCGLNWYFNWLQEQSSKSWQM
jgi:hypothetical protein